MSTESKKFCPVCMREVTTEGVVCPTCGGALTILHSRDLVGETLDGRYEILEMLARGGMGVVYRARHRFLDKEVAVKVLRTDAASETRSVARFLQEAKRTSVLASPNTVRVTDFGVTPEGLLYLVMELLRGQSLSALILAEKKLDWRRTFGYAVQVCSSLAEAHDKGIWHRDIKPDNIFVVGDEADREIVKVVDFGISKWTEAKETVTDDGVICGTPEYISPEQARGQPVDARSDIYSLAAVLYEAIAGRPPFAGDTPVKIILSHVIDKPQPLKELDPSLPAVVSNVIMWALKKRPSRRPATVREFSEALQAVLDGVRADPAGADRAALADEPTVAAIAGELTVPALSEETGEPAPKLAEEEELTDEGMPAIRREVAPVAAGAPARPQRPSTAEQTVPAPLTRSRVPLLAAAAGLAVAFALAAWWFWPRTGHGPQEGNRTSERPQTVMQPASVPDKHADATPLALPAAQPDAAARRESAGAADAHPDVREERDAQADAPAGHPADAGGPLFPAPPDVAAAAQHADIAPDRKPGAGSDVTATPQPPPKEERKPAAPPKDGGKKKGGDEKKGKPAEEDDYTRIPSQP